MQPEISVPREGMRGGHSPRATHSATAASHIDPAQPEGRLGQVIAVTQRKRVEAATNTDPGDAGRESGQCRTVTHLGCAALAKDPPQGGAGGSRTSDVVQRGRASPAEASADPQGASPVGAGRSGQRTRVGAGATPAGRTRRAAPAKDRKPRGKRSGVDHLRSDAQYKRVDPALVSEIGGDAEGRVGQPDNDIQRALADAATQIPGDGEGRVDQLISDSRIKGADPAIINEIREQWRRRQAWHRAEKSLTLQAKALCRRLATDGDKDEADTIYKAAQGDGTHEMADIALAATFPLTEARDGVERHRKAVESRLRKLAKQLPIAPWVEAIPGASLNTLAAIVGEAGDIGAFPYTNPAKLWKRMGLAVMPDGTRQQKRDGDGYAPGRRSVVWNIGGSLIGGMGRGPRLEPGQAVGDVEGLSDLQRIFVRRIRYEAERNPDHARPVTKAGKESFSKHAAARAKRYVEKRFLLLMWKEWRRASVSASEKTIQDVPAAELIREAA